MKRLKELVFLIDGIFGDKLDFLEDKKSNMLSQLYLGTLSEKWNTDEQAAGILYKGKTSSSAYRKLKMTLKQKLVQLLFTTDPGIAEKSDRQKAYYQCAKDSAAIKILMAKNARLIGVDLCKKLLRTAVKYDFTDYSREAASLLRVHYGAMTGDIRRFEHYKALYDKYNELDHEENLAEEMYTQLIMNYVNNRSNHKSYHKKAKKYYARLEKKLETHGGFKLHLYGRLIQSVIYSSVHDHDGTIKACEKAIAYFDMKGYSTDSTL